MSPKPEPRSEKLAVLYEGRGDILPFRELAERLAVPLLHAAEVGAEDERLYLSWREGCLKLLDQELLKKGGLSVDIEPRQGEQRSWPAPKQNILAQAIGRRTRTVIDATTGWGQDSLAIFRMGYDLLCLERSPVMAELLADGFRRLSDLDWMRRLQLEPPRLLIGDAIALLSELTSRPDCIYLDPMFPPKRKKSALTRKSMALLHDLVGEDTDKEQLFAAAFRATGKRVVVKSPDYAEPLGGKPKESFQGKLLRYDVYLKDSN
jgi:16S rRNA (guanine1516-N2)-methyltransferase